MEMATKEPKPRANPATKASWGRQPVDGWCALAAEGEAQGAWAMVGGRAHQSVHLLRSMHQGCGYPLDDDEAGKHATASLAKSRPQAGVPPPERERASCLEQTPQPCRSRGRARRRRRGAPLGPHSSLPHCRLLTVACSLSLARRITPVVLILFSLLDVSAAVRVAGEAAAKGNAPGVVAHATYVAYEIRTEDEVDVMAEALKHDLRRRFGISRQGSVDSRAQAEGNLRVRTRPGLPALPSAGVVRPFRTRFHPALSPSSSGGARGPA